MEVTFGQRKKKHENALQLLEMRHWQWSKGFTALAHIKKEDTGLRKELRMQLKVNILHNQNKIEERQNRINHMNRLVGDRIPSCILQCKQTWQRNRGRPCKYICKVGTVLKAYTMK
jgi:hypothetical protein